MTSASPENTCTPPGAVDRTGADRAAIYDVSVRDDVHFLHSTRSGSGASSSSRSRERRRSRRCCSHPDFRRLRKRACDSRRVRLRHDHPDDLLRRLRGDVSTRHGGRRLLLVYQPRWGIGQNVVVDVREPECLLPGRFDQILAAVAERESHRPSAHGVEVSLAGRILEPDALAAHGNRVAAAELRGGRAAFRLLRRFFRAPRAECTVGRSGVSSGDRLAAWP